MSSPPHVSARQDRTGAPATEPRPRVLAHLYLDTHVGYSHDVSEPTVNREAWAHEIARLIQDEARGNKSEFARLVGVRSVKTVDRWLARTVNVSEESVRQVARALNLPVADLLIKVGLLDPADLTPAAAASPDADAEAIRIIEAAEISPNLKRQLINHLQRQRAEHELQRLAEVQRTIDLLRPAR